ncbi:hypothetical protein LXA43DRAFT_423208 [Ganoderma leucocontextum]|nr:hypothetical protein LXA43DRAFT_423208 [Ganoderma leucocontextum]
MPHIATTILPHPELASTLPKSDADALMEVSDASQLRALTQRKIEEYKNHISTLLAIHNSIAPINTLPTEIFQEIVAYVPSVSTWCDTLWMLSLGSVCRRWHLILLATPEYWVRGLHTVMDPSCAYYRDSDHSDDSEDITRGRALFLARSAPWPLEIPLEYSSCEDGPGWDAFEDHFDRVTVFEVAAQDADDLDIILNVVTSSMKRLERLQLEVEYSKVSTKDLLEWQAEELPCLGRLEITSALFCCATTVPSLHTVILKRPPRDVASLPRLFDALEECPALATLRLELTHKDDTFQNRTLKRVLDLPNLRNLVVSGGISDVRCFLSGLTFPSATLVELDVLDTDNEQDRGLVLPNVLPKRLSVVRAHQMLDGIDRLCFHSNHRARSEDQQVIMSMRGYIQGAERLRITPAFWLRNADRFLQVLALFRECRVAQLALDLRYVPSDLDEEFWTKFFTALPDLRRLELLSPTAESRAIKRDIATHYLASCRVPQLAPETDVVNFLYRITPPRRAVSLAWVLRADQNNISQLEAELSDVEQVLSGHADAGARLERLELYVTTSKPHPYQPQALDVTQVKTDGRASRLVAREHVSRLEDAAEVVIVGGGWEFAEDDILEPDVDVCENEEEEVSSSSDM